MEAGSKSSEWESESGGRRTPLFSLLSPHRLSLFRLRNAPNSLNRPALVVTWLRVAAAGAQSCQRNRRLVARRRAYWPVMKSCVRGRSSLLCSVFAIIPIKANLRLIADSRQLHKWRPPAGPSRRHGGALRNGPGHGGWAPTRRRAP